MRPDCRAGLDGHERAEARQSDSILRDVQLLLEGAPKEVLDCLLEKRAE